MAQGTLHDGSTGDVVIRSGPPASGGGGGGFGGGGGGGGNRVGASGNFGGPSAKTRALRRQANLARQEKEAIEAKEKADATARAQEQARTHTRQQLLAGLVQRHDSVKAELDPIFAARAEQLPSSLEQEISAATRAPDNNTNERWQLYLITKEKNEIDGLITRKVTELNAISAVVQSFDGHDPLTRTTNDYLARLEQFGEAHGQGHQLWERAYNAAHESRLLTAQLAALTQRSNALAVHHAQQTIVWRERDANWERHRQIAEQREARIRFKQQADADARLERVRQANTLSLTVTSSGFSAGVNSYFNGRWPAALSDKLVTAAAIQSVSLLSRALPAPHAVIFMGGMLYPSELADGELTPEQRNRLLNAVVVPAHSLGLHDSGELQAIADAGGSVEGEHRVKPLATDEGIANIVAKTGGDIDPWIPVVNATLDPLTGAYVAEVPGSPSRYVHFMPEAVPHTQVSSETPLAVTQPQIQAVPTGVDWRIQDCIVCVPGFDPVYLSFSVPPMGTGVVIGNGEAAKADWWKGTGQASGAAIPSQIGDRFRGREFKSFEAFNQGLWQTLGEYPLLTGQLDEINQRRLKQGFPPVAPKSTWVDGNREFELRYDKRENFWSDSFNLDRVSIKAPNSAGGWLGVLPAVTPWPIPSATSWKPLVPPGSEHLGSTASPITPTVPAVYPGNPANPVLPENETLPTVDEGEIGASIPGFPGDMELPSPDALFRDRRDDPGVATGVGQTMTGVRLGDAARGDGAPIPSHIADQLRGREFANFHRFREAFWRAVAADPGLSSQFSATNLRFMRKGTAPFPSKNDQYGGRVKFELHHQLEIAKGGAVYDMDNIVVMTPRQHVLLHKGGDQL